MTTQKGLESSQSIQSTPVSTLSEQQKEGPEARSTSQVHQTGQKREEMPVLSPDENRSMFAFAAASNQLS